MTSPTSFRDLGARTGSWSKALSRMVSMASEQGDVDVTVVTGLRRRVRIVALEKESEGLPGVKVGDGGLVGGGVGGRRSLAASQSSSTNCEYQYRASAQKRDWGGNPPC